MADLEDTFGEDFAKNLRQKTAERRERRNKVTEEAKQEIAFKILNEEAFGDGSEPHFTYTDKSGVSHNVLLMEVPDPNSKSFFAMVRELDSGAVTAPLNYLGEFMSCLFNDSDMVKELEEGEQYVMIGQMDQWTDDSGKTHDQLQPVRGVMNLEQLNAYAREFMDGEEEKINDPEPDNADNGEADGIDPAEFEPEPSEEDELQEMEEPEDEDEPEEDDDEPQQDEPSDEELSEQEPEKEDSPWSSSSSDDEEEEDDDDDFLSGDDDEDEEEDEDNLQEDVYEIVEQLASNQEAVWEVEQGSSRHKKVAKVTANRLELDTSDADLMGEVAELVWERIEKEQEDEEPEEEEEDDEDEEDSLF